MRRAAALIVASAMALGPAPMVGIGSAHAQDDVASKVEDLSRKGATAYKAKDYPKAIEYFSAAYEIEPVPNLLYNIAKCYEKSDQPEQALEYYEKFVLEPEIDENARKNALQKSAQMRDLIDAREDLEREKERREREKERDKLAKGDGSDTGDGTKGSGEPEPASNPLPWVVVGAGGLLVAGGAVAGVMALGEQTRFDEATTAEEKQAARESGTTLALVADGLYVAGAVAVGVGAFLVLTGGEAESAEKEGAQVTPWLGAGSGGVDVRWRF